MVGDNTNRREMHCHSGKGQNLLRQGLFYGELYFMGTGSPAKGHLKLNATCARIMSLFKRLFWFHDSQIACGIILSLQPILVSFLSERQR
jgi:hypothetical protein